MLAAAPLLGACASGPAASGDDGGARCLRFDGVDDYVTLPTSGFPTGVEPMTIELWLRPARTASTQTLAKVGRGSLSGVQLGLDGAFPTAWRVWGPTVFAASETPVDADAWHRLAYVFDGTTHRLHVDGALVGSGDAYANNRSPTLVWLGALDGVTEFFAGELDELRIWNRARSEAELAATEPTEDDARGLVLHLTFDERAGARLFDRSPEGNDGLLGDGVRAFMPQRVASDRRR